jgi:hypothetical protein
MQVIPEGNKRSLLRRKGKAKGIRDNLGAFPGKHRTTILPNVVGRMTAKRKVAGSNLVTDDFPTCNPTYLQLWALWAPGEESWGRSKTGE